MIEQKLEQKGFVFAPTKPNNALTFAACFFLLCGLHSFEIYKLTLFVAISIKTPPFNTNNLYIGRLNRHRQPLPSSTPAAPRRTTVLSLFLLPSPIPPVCHGSPPFQYAFSSLCIQFYLLCVFFFLILFFLFCFLRSPSSVVFSINIYERERKNCLCANEWP